MNDNLPAERSAFGRPPERPPTASRFEWAAEPEPDPETIDLAALIGVFRRHIGAIVLITLLTTAAAAWFAFTAVPQYRAKASVRLQDNRAAMTGGMDVNLANAAIAPKVDPLTSQIEALRSRSVLSNVVDRENLRLEVASGLPVRLLENVAVAGAVAADTITLEFRADGYTVAHAGAAPVAARYGEPVSLAGVTFGIAERPASSEEAVLSIVDQDVAIDRLHERLVVRPRNTTDIVDIEYESRDPMQAQRVVNATADVFRERSQASAREQATLRREFLEGQLAEMDVVLAAAQDAITEFQGREQVQSSEGRFAAQQVNLLNLDLRRQEAEAERDLFAGLLREIRRADPGDSDALRTLMSSLGPNPNPVLTQNYAQITRFEQTLDSLRTAGTARTHPDFIQADARLVNAQLAIMDGMQSHVRALDARISSLSRLAEVQERDLASMPAAQAEEARLVLQAETVQKMADQLREEAQRARLAEAVEAGTVEVLDHASEPRSPLPQRRNLKLALGMMLGLMLGGGFAMTREFLNTSLLTREEVEQRTGIPALCVVPRAVAGSHKGSVLSRLRPGQKAVLPARAHPQVDEHIVALHDPRSAAAEAYRVLRTGLIFSQAASEIRSLVVTSAVAAEGKSTTAANLAVSYAQQGLLVLLVDADLRRPSQHAMFGADKSPGLTEVVLGHVVIEDALQRTPQSGLFMLPAGTEPPNPAELVGGTRMGALFDDLSERFDLVIYDTAPVLAASEAAILAARADATVTVVRAGHTHRASVMRTIYQLRAVGARSVGIVLNDVEGKVPAYDRSEYYYTYYGKSGRDAGGPPEPVRAVSSHHG